MTGLGRGCSLTRGLGDCGREVRFLLGSRLRPPELRIYFVPRLLTAPKSISEARSLDAAYRSGADTDRLIGIRTGVRRTRISAR